MKQIGLTILLLSVSLGFSQQTFQGKAIYKSHRKINMGIDSSTLAKNPDLKNTLEEEFRKLFHQTYTLNFTKTESTYRQNAKLNSPNQNVAMTSSNGKENDVLYKNLKENRFSNKINFLGKQFLIKDKLLKYDWVFTGETKNIGNYTAYKTTWTRKIKRKKKGEKTQKEEERTAIVWYTPDIPVNNGPGDWWGLPGLILEVNDGKKTLVCTEVILNLSKKINIKEPKKGEIVTLEKYKKIVDEKLDDVLERNKGVLPARVFLGDH